MEKLRAAGAAERVARGLPAEGLELGFGGGARLCDEFCFGPRVWEEVYIQAHPQVMLGSTWPSLSILGIRFLYQRPELRPLGQPCAVCVPQPGGGAVAGEREPMLR